MTDNGFARAQYVYENMSPPEPRECCEHWDEPDHDNEACWYDQQEAAAEAKAEQKREDDMMWERERRGW